jgi:hypothetical protein
MNFEISGFESSNGIATVLHSNDESFEINMDNKCLNSLNYLNQVGRFSWRVNRIMAELL